jgi:hypothetical protein
MGTPVSRNCSWVAASEGDRPMSWRRVCGRGALRARALAEAAEEDRQGAGEAERNGFLHGLTPGRPERMMGGGDELLFLSLVTMKAYVSMQAPHARRCARSRRILTDYRLSPQTRRDRPDPALPRFAGDGFPIESQNGTAAPAPIGKNCRVLTLAIQPGRAEDRSGSERRLLWRLWCLPRGVARQRGNHSVERRARQGSTHRSRAAAIPGLGVEPVCFVLGITLRDELGQALASLWAKIPTPSDWLKRPLSPALERLLA